MKQLEVQIMQQSYLLGCPEGREARLMDAVERIAVLAPLNLAFELADREAAELAAAAHIPPLSAAAPMGTTGTDAAMPPHSTERLQALVQRIDEVLGSDGHLLGTRPL